MSPQRFLVLFVLSALLAMVPAEARAQGPQLQYVEGYLTNQQGHRQDLFQPKDKGVFIYIFFKNLETSKAHEHDLKVQVYAPDGKTYGRPLGGIFRVEAGEDITTRDFPRTIDATGHNGFLIAGENMAGLSGEYRMVVEVDGRKVGEIPFRIVSNETELVLSSTFIANAEGRLKEEFLPTDRAVFVYAFFKNLKVDRPHGHRFRAVFYSPSGKQHGRVLGGDFQVRKNADMTRVDFPRSSDPQQHNGFFIEQRLDTGESGEYRIVLELDGRVVREIKYRLGSPGASLSGSGGAP